MANIWYCPHTSRRHIDCSPAAAFDATERVRPSTKMPASGKIIHRIMESRCVRQYPGYVAQQKCKHSRKTSQSCLLPFKLWAKHGKATSSLCLWWNVLLFVDQNISDKIYNIYIYVCNNYIYIYVMADSPLFVDFVGWNSHVTVCCQIAGLWVLTNFQGSSLNQWSDVSFWYTLQ